MKIEGAVNFLIYFRGRGRITAECFVVVIWIRWTFGGGCERV